MDVGVGGGSSCCGGLFLCLLSISAQLTAGALLLLLELAPQLPCWPLSHCLVRCFRNHAHQALLARFRIRCSPAPHACCEASAPQPLPLSPSCSPRLRPPPVPPLPVGWCQLVWGLPGCSPVQLREVLVAECLLPVLAPLLPCPRLGWLLAVRGAGVWCADPPMARVAVLAAADGPVRPPPSSPCRMGIGVLVAAWLAVDAATGLSVALVVMVGGAAVACGAVRPPLLSALVVVVEGAVVVGGVVRSPLLSPRHFGVGALAVAWLAPAAAVVESARSAVAESAAVGGGVVRPPPSSPRCLGGGAVVVAWLAVASWVAGVVVVSSALALVVLWGWQRRYRLVPRVRRCEGLVWVWVLVSRLGEVGPGDREVYVCSQSDHVRSLRPLHVCGPSRRRRLWWWVGEWWPPALVWVRGGLWFGGVPRVVFWVVAGDGDCAPRPLPRRIGLCRVPTDWSWAVVGRCHGAGRAPPGPGWLAVCRVWTGPEPPSVRGVVGSVGLGRSLHSQCPCHGHVHVLLGVPLPLVRWWLRWRSRCAGLVGPRGSAVLGAAPVCAVAPPCVLWVGLSRAAPPGRLGVPRRGAPLPRELQPPSRAIQRCAWRVVLCVFVGCPTLCVLFKQARLQYRTGAVTHATQTAVCCTLQRLDKTKHVQSACSVPPAHGPERE